MTELEGHAHRGHAEQDRCEGEGGSRRRAVPCAGSVSDESWLAADLELWREANGAPSERTLLFPGDRGELWTANGFEKWRQPRYHRLLAAAELHSGRPYDLRHSFASLLLHEGRDVIYVARQLGHGAELTLRTYGHVIEELEDSPQLSAEEAIRRRASTSAAASVPVLYPRAAHWRGPTAGFGSVGPRPDLDSNQGPTP